MMKVKQRILLLLLQGPDLGGSFHWRCEQTQTQQAKYNEFGREAGLRTGLCEDAFNGWAGSLGNWIVNSVVRGKVKARPRSSIEDDFFFSSSDTPPIELLGVFQIAVIFFVKSPWLYILLFSSSWPSICRLRRSPLECLSHLALPSTCCEWQWLAWHCSGVIPSLMWPDCQLRAFNAEVTGSPTMVLLPCSYSCPPTLVPLFGDDGEGCGGWRTALSSQGTNSPRT